MKEQNNNMTENEVQAILVGILKHWKSLTPAEVKGLLKILIVRGELPKCAACGEPIYTMDDFSWDHSIPESKGGPTLIGNLQPMHTWCNVAKGDEIDEQYFCHIDPELLQQMTKSRKKRGSRSNSGTKSKSKKNYENSPEKRRKHMRINGASGIDISAYSRGKRGSR